MAKKDSNTTMIEKNKESIKKVSSKVHEELLNTSHLFIDETVSTLTRMQTITGKAIKKSEPIIEKQIEITFDAVESLKEQAEKGGKRALKLLGLTKQFNKLSETIEEKINEIPSTDKMIENAKELVASAKSDVEETINKASESIKSITNIGDQEVVEKAEKIGKRVISKTGGARKIAKKTVKKATQTVKASAAKASKITKAAPATKKPTPTKTVKAKTTIITKTPTKAVAPKVAKKPVAKAKVTVVKKTATPKPATSPATKSDLTQVKGIGPSLAKIMNDNGIKTIKDLQNATPSALKIVATKAGNRYKSFDTTKWITASKAIK